MVGPSILIAALSGRAAAMAARRAGLVPYVADLFADEDTRSLAAGARRVEGGLSSGFEEAALLGALEALAARMPEPPVGVAYGAGFEDRPDLLRRIAERWPLLGNAPETVEAVKDPWRFADMLARLGIPHPEIRTAMSGTPPSGWLVKREGGAGGGHVRRVSVETASSATSAGKKVGGPSPSLRGAERRSNPPASTESVGGLLHPLCGFAMTPRSFYFQRSVAGRPVSALFVASALGARIIGFSEQWTAPAPGEPFRFGGAVGSADIPDDLAAALGRAVEKLTPVFGLRGLNSADFIVGPDGWWLLEINPRLGATLDIFDTAAGALFAAHMDAVRGGTPAAAERCSGARALQLVYAPVPVAHVPRLDWPHWSADRPPAGAVIPTQAPCCTVLASADTACEARRLCRERVDYILKLMGVEECRRAS